MYLRTKLQRGITLLEAVITLGIIAIGMLGLAKIGNSFSEDARNVQYADTVKQFAVASRNYMRDNYTTITAGASPTSAYVITASMLSAGGYLPANASSKVGYGQDICTVVLEPTAGKLNGLVVAEQGDTLDDVTLSSILGIGGGSMGAVLSTSTSTVTGAKNGWSFPVSDFDAKPNQLGRRCDGVSSGTVRVGTGHAVMALWYEGNTAQSSALYRDAVPGQPQLNQMNAPIVFNATQLLGAACTTSGAISNDSTGKLVNCTGGTWQQVASMYWADPVGTFATLPACNASVLGVTRVVRAPTVGTGPRPYTCDGTSWRAISIDDSGNLSLPGVLSAGKVTLVDVVVSGTACATNGQVARDAAGVILSCQSGVWRGGGVPGYEIVSNTVSSSGHFDVFVTCPGSKKIMGGGCYDSAASQRALVRSNPVGDTTWQCRSRDVNIGQYTSLTAYAICMSP